MPTSRKMGTTHDRQKFRGRTVTPAATPGPVFKVINISVSGFKASEAISASRSWEEVHLLIVLGCRWNESSRVFTTRDLNNESNLVFDKVFTTRNILIIKREACQLVVT